jgi:chemotaxis receptor (MCP) glutamine deamidase CheD
MSKPIIVSMDSYEVANFREVESIRTNDLLRCVAVVAYSKQRGLGAVAHLTIYSDVRSYVDHITADLGAKGTKVYLVGGSGSEEEYFTFSERCAFIDESRKAERNSAEIVRDLEKELSRQKLRITRRNLFGNRTRNVVLYSDGRVVVEFKPDCKTSEKNRMAKRFLN